MASLLPVYLIQNTNLLERIEKEPEETCLYKRLLLDYTYGLERIYTRQEIEKAKASPSFEREYNLKYLGGIGNVFNPALELSALVLSISPFYTMQSLC